MTASIWREIDRVKRDIEHLREVIAENPDAGRYVRALQARVRDYGRLVRTLAETCLAKPLPQTPLQIEHFRDLDMTDEEREWLEGRADCPCFKGRESDLAAIRLKQPLDAHARGAAETPEL